MDHKRNLDPCMSPTGNNRLAQSRIRKNFADNLEILRDFKDLSQYSALLSPCLIEDNSRNMTNIRVNRVSQQE